MTSWEAHLCPRGGGSPVAVLPFVSLRTSRRLDDMGTAQLSGVADSEGWAAVGGARNWEHELVLWRGDHNAFAGPLTSTSVQAAGGWSVSARDLFQWFERRFAATARTFTDDDLALIFRRIAVDALAGDTSPNIAVLARACGVRGDRTVDPADYARAADLLRELARTGVDWTFVGRDMRVGGEEVPAVALATLVDEQVMGGTADWDGVAAVNDVVVRGSTPAGAVVGTAKPVGRATRGPSAAELGLLQRRFDESLVLDVASANAAAVSRADLLAVTDLPSSLKLVVTPDVADAYPDLVPGARIDVALSASLFARQIVGTFRLLEVAAAVSAGSEQVTLSLQPPGAGV